MWFISRALCEYFPQTCTRWRTGSHSTVMTIIASAGGGTIRGGRRDDFTPATLDIWQCLALKLISPFAFSLSRPLAQEKIFSFCLSLPLSLSGTARRFSVPFWWAFWWSANRIESTFCAVKAASDMEG